MISSKPPTDTGERHRAYYVKVVEEHGHILRVKCSLKNLVLAIYHLWRYSQGITPSKGLKVKRPLLLAKI